jgi:hypothetical protein
VSARAKVSEHEHCVVRSAPLSGYRFLRRITIFTRAGIVEVTCLPSEESAIAQWALDSAQSGGFGPLPAGEYWRSPWTSAYRWTLAADREYRARCRRAA